MADPAQVAGMVLVEEDPASVEAVVVSAVSAVAALVAVVLEEVGEYFLIKTYFLSYF